MVRYSTPSPLSPCVRMSKIALPLNECQFQRKGKDLVISFNSPDCTAQHSTAQNRTVLYRAVQHSTTPLCTILLCNALNSIILMKTRSQVNTSGLQYNKAFIQNQQRSPMRSFLLCSSLRCCLSSFPSLLLPPPL